MNEQEMNSLTERVIACAIQVHKELGPGLLESTYASCLRYELLNRGIQVRRNVPVTILYRGVRLEEGYWIDLLVEEVLVLELKSVEKLHPVHAAQLLSYLRLSGLQLGLLINFNVSLLTHGIKRIINGWLAKE